MAYNCQIFEAVSLTIHGCYTCVYSSLSYWHKYRKQNMSAREGIHKWSLMIKNIVSKCIVHIHITSELKAYLLVMFSLMCSNVGSVCILQ